MKWLAWTALALFACTNTSDIEETGDTDTGETGTEVEPTWCQTQGLTEHVFETEGEFGFRRRTLAEDFEITLLDGTTWRLSENWTGCDATVFIPHYFPIGATDNRSVWNTGVSELIARSAPNSRYIFFVVGNNPAQIADFAEPLQADIDSTLATLTDEEASWWADRLLVAGQVTGQMDNWIKILFSADVGTYGMGIDRFQRVRPLGSLASVEAYNPNTPEGEWPFDRRLFSAAYEARYWNYEARRQVELDAVDATEVVLWEKSVHEEYEDITITLPSAEEIAGYDTLEIDVLMECPNPAGYEPGNCGPWDYLAYMWLRDEADTSWMEMARFITTYHRESRWVVDASHALPWIKDGGDRTLRYEWAPSWNKQPSSLTVKLRLSNQGKEVKPVETVHLFGGGSFGSAYNDREPVAVTIPSDAKKVELVALTTGHGMDKGNCAEFCDQKHEFTVGSAVHVQDLNAPGDDTHCAEDVDNGTVPNQLGTWWFGRSGWCPGREVYPFVVDITGDVSLGAEASVSYRGLYQGSTPADGHGNIKHNSWIVIHK